MLKDKSVLPRRNPSSLLLVKRHVANLSTIIICKGAERRQTSSGTIKKNNSYQHATIFLLFEKRKRQLPDLELEKLRLIKNGRMRKGENDKI